MSDDPLEAGLEIFAKPPGKKPTSRCCRAASRLPMTPLALIFAVFLTNSASICVRSTGLMLRSTMPKSKRFCVPYSTR